MRQIQTTLISVADLAKLMEPALSRVGYTLDGFRVLNEQSGTQVLAVGSLLGSRASNIIIELTAIKDVDPANASVTASMAGDLERKLSMSL